MFASIHVALTVSVRLHTNSQLCYATDVVYYLHMTRSRSFVSLSVACWSVDGVSVLSDTLYHVLSHSLFSQQLSLLPINYDKSSNMQIIKTLPSDFPASKTIALNA